jgi:hypothetical protein
MMVEFKTLNDLRIDRSDLVSYYEIKDSGKYDFVVDEYADGSVEKVSFLPVDWLGGEDDEYVKKSDLRKEAIKWVAYWDDLLKLSISNDNHDLKKCAVELSAESREYQRICEIEFKMNIIKLESRITTFKHFFNITEKDMEVKR